jgi:hypothetical protein
LTTPGPLQTRDENDVAPRDSLYGLIRNVEHTWRDAIDKIPASQSQYPLTIALPQGDAEIARAASIIASIMRKRALRPMTLRSANKPIPMEDYEIRDRAAPRHNARLNRRYPGLLLSISLSQIDRPSLLITC